MLMQADPGYDQTPTPMGECDPPRTRLCGHMLPLKLAGSYPSLLAVITAESGEYAPGNRGWIVDEG